MRHAAKHWKAAVAAVVLLAGAAAAQPAAPPQKQVRYTISLADATRSLLRVRMELPPGPAERTVQMPVWNATYQVRDFVQFVRGLRARSMAAAAALPLTKRSSSTWILGGAQAGAVIEYEFLAILPGPFGAEFNREHAFLNLAMVLMYAEDARALPVAVGYEAPPGWNVMQALADPSAANYDRLVDAPVEIGPRRVSYFDEGGARYGVVVHAEAGDYNAVELTSMLRRIVRAGAEWMEAKPDCPAYLFVYHFPRRPAGGGMEHACSTAIDFPADMVKNSVHSLAAITAHEFFHLWNVKRIRPQSLEPVDYTREQPTRTLWFAEGVTSTVGDYILLRAGLLDERRYLAQLGGAVTQLHSRPARLWQSAEEASLDAWLEKYPAYHDRERSISYYNKGEVLGIMLDLAIREGSGGRHSLRDVFHLLEREWARRGRMYDDSRTIREIAEQLTGKDFSSFFSRYVSGVEEIPYDDFLRTVGLRLVQQGENRADVGFELAHLMEGERRIAAVIPGSAAEHAGLSVGDQVRGIGKESNPRRFQQVIEQARAGQRLRLRVARDGREQEMMIVVGRRPAERFEIADLPQVTEMQRSQRRAWLSGDRVRAAAAAGAER